MSNSACNAERVVGKVMINIGAVRLCQDAMLTKRFSKHIKSSPTQPGFLEVVKSPSLSLHDNTFLAAKSAAPPLSELLGMLHTEQLKYG